MRLERHHMTLCRHYMFFPKLCGGFPLSVSMGVVPAARLASCPVPRRRPGARPSDAQAADLVRVPALPCTREHRKINFHQKNTSDLQDFFSCFCHGSREQPAGSSSREQPAGSSMQVACSRQQFQPAAVGSCGRQQWAGCGQTVAVRQAASGSSRQALPGR